MCSPEARKSDALFILTQGTGHEVQFSCQARRQSKVIRSRKDKPPPPPPPPPGYSGLLTSKTCPLAVLASWKFCSVALREGLAPAAQRSRCMMWPSTAELRSLQPQSSASCTDREVSICTASKERGQHGSQVLAIIPKKDLPRFYKDLFFAIWKTFLCHLLN